MVIFRPKIKNIDLSLKIRLNGKQKYGPQS